MKSQLARFQEKQVKLAQASSQGIGGLKFVSLSPPGLGRLVRIPFYIETAVARFGPRDGLHTGDASPAGIPGQDFDPWTGLITTTSWASATHPIVTVVFPFAGVDVTPVAVMRTPQVSWATLRIVGFEAFRYGAEADRFVPMQVAFGNLRIGGGQNLFVHNGFAPSDLFLAGQDTFAGLREYPLLVSPNVAEVSVQALGADGFAITQGPSTPVAFSCNLVCDVLLDDQTSAHTEGPYARTGATVRVRRKRNTA